MYAHRCTPVGRIGGTRYRLAVAATALGLCIGGTSVQADGEFLQLDVSESTTGATASVGRGPLLVGGNAVDFDGGSAYGLSATYRLPFASDIATLRIGPSLGYILDDDDDDDLQAGAKLVAERYIPTDFGGLFVLADLNTIEQSWFVLSQATFARPGVGVELSSGASDTYSETSLALSAKLPGRPVSLRIGYRFEAEEVFAGVSINTF